MAEAYDRKLENNDNKISSKEKFNLRLAYYCFIDFIRKLHISNS